MINFLAGAARESIAPDDVEALRAAGALVEDPRCEMPRYFDGRFLAARDLIRDQQYFLTREAELGQTQGGGVASGLRVTRGAAADELRVDPGHGLTPAGELTLVPRTLSVRLADVPHAEQLSARFGLSRIPQPPLRSRSGLFVLGLRPVEFTANPIGAYPTAITGQRTVEDGDVIEATAVVLIPWTNDDASDSLDARRSRAARAIFVENRPSGVSANVLPLAMLGLQNNIIAWVDVAMVRRELGADRADRPGLGIGGRALRLAHLMQYQAHLSDALSQNAGRPFPAAARFSGLPPVGPLPPGIIAPGAFTQNYFPAEIDAELAPIPEDELPALVDEALSLPGIDLTATPDMLDSTAVLILAPVPRSNWRTTIAALQPEQTDPLTRKLVPTAANRLAARKPLEILQRIRLPQVLTVLPKGDTREQKWAQLATQPNLWFVRRRNLAYRDDLPGVAVRFAGSESVLKVRTLDRLDGIGLRPQLDAVVARAEPAAASDVTALLSTPRIAASPALTAAVLGDLARAPTLDRASVLAVSARVTQPGVGEGLVRLEQSEGDALKSPEVLTRIAASEDWRKTDDAARSATVAAVPKLAADLAGRTTVAKPATPAVKAPEPPATPASPGRVRKPAPK